MDFEVWDLAELSVKLIETLGIVVISAGVIVAVFGTVRARLADSTSNYYRTFRRQMSRWLLLGLELLIAADVIRTVTLDLDLASVAALGILILIRTFLVWTIMLENTGYWPWQRPSGAATEPEI